MLSWSMGLLALCMLSIGMCVAIDPGNFLPPTTDPKALLRRRIVLPICFFFGAVFAVSVLLTFTLFDYPAWFGLLVGCPPLLVVIPAVAIWVQVVGRLRRRGGDRTTTAPH
jgi:hypothetical protein